MSYLDALILAIVEGLTEFLPISSTGHMIIASSLLGIASEPFTKTFTVAIQLGAILSVVVLYWKRFFKSFDFYLKLMVAFIPAGIVGLLFEDKIDELMESVEVVGFTLVAGGVFFLFIDRMLNDSENNKTEVSYPSALKIGLFQIVALIPGVSRSAATIIGGMFQKLNKQTAAEFSFFLAVPTMFAATAWKLLKFYLSGNTFGGGEVTLLIFGNVIAFIVAMVAIRSFITILTRYGFKWFGYYRIALGAIILILSYMGVSLTII